MSNPFITQAYRQGYLPELPARFELRVPSIMCLERFCNGLVANRRSSSSPLSESTTKQTLASMFVYIGGRRFVKSALPLP